MDCGGLVVVVVGVGVVVVGVVVVGVVVVVVVVVVGVEAAWAHSLLKTDWAWIGLDCVA